MASSVSHDCIPLLLVGPHGAGKSSLFDILVKKYQFEFCFHSICTTKPSNPEDSSDDDNIVVTNETFKQMIEQKDFIEAYQSNSGNYYGYAKSTIVA